MTFNEQIASTFMGSIFGFLFALALFYFTEKLKGRRERKNLLRNLRRELRYNLELINKWIDDLDKLLRKVSANERNVFTYLRYSDYQRLFVDICFSRGFLYDMVNNEHVAQLNAVLFHLGINIENYVNNTIQQWKDGEIDPTKMLSQFEFERDQLKEFCSHIKRLLLEVSK